MIVRYSRESMCMGDDVYAGIYELDIPEQTTIRQLVDILYEGGYGNTWPVPIRFYHDSYWIIQTNIGAVAIIICDHAQELHIEFPLNNQDKTIQDTGIHSVYACRPVEYFWKAIDQSNYRDILQTLKTASEKLVLLQFS
ncbi:MAG: hypothetical protein IJM59_11290 [Proteobacteria bacterium]|nr:hypothetical protein [Pseudomonadota bacterium]